MSASLRKGVNEVRRYIVNRKPIDQERTHSSAWLIDRIKEPHMRLNYYLSGENMVPLKVANLAAFLFYRYKFLSRVEDNK
ncbi:hypothetical protein C172_06289 [Paenibacillus sp. FSL H8-457]|nr:hypothetical protein C172_06289 [Paenibacillus sp. FSL H8-457]